MPAGPRDSFDTLKALRPFVPARDFELSKKFYTDIHGLPQPTPMG